MKAFHLVAAALIATAPFAAVPAMAQSVRETTGVTSVLGAAPGGAHCEQGTAMSPQSKQPAGATRVAPARRFMASTSTSRYEILAVATMAEVLAALG